jgi:hypothetical protein
MSRKGAETDFILISEAVARLKVGMYASLNQPEPIAKIKKVEPRLSIELGAQKEDAAERIYEAIEKGKLSVFALSTSTEDRVHEPHLQVPLNVLKQMILTRGGLPDHAIEPIRIFAKASIAPELLAALSKSELYIRRKEFDAWYEEAREKNNWPSQHTSRKLRKDGSFKPSMGRPSKQNHLRNPIIALVNERCWSARQKIADLVRLLEAKQIKATRDTVSRVVDQLFKEKGDQRYRRDARKRSQLKRSVTGQGITGI